MNDSIYLSIQNSPRFKELVSKRERFAWILSAIMLGLYAAFILLIAYGPHYLGNADRRRADPFCVCVDRHLCSPCQWRI
ncbi:putative membrane protein [Pseudomonas syringae group genomosp. 3]|nr:putative membrane protein [Pseudomonas syringae group genomosp. 3]